MKKLTIKSISPLGQKAITKHIKEYSKLKARAKVYARMIGMIHEVVSDSEISLSFSNRSLETDGFILMAKNEIQTAFKESGAELGTDYTVEVVTV